MEEKKTREYKKLQDEQDEVLKRLFHKEESSKLSLTLQVFTCSANLYCLSCCSAVREEIRQKFSFGVYVKLSKIGAKERESLRAFFFDIPKFCEQLERGLASGRVQEWVLQCEDNEGDSCWRPVLMVMETVPTLKLDHGDWEGELRPWENQAVVDHISKSTHLKEIQLIYGDRSFGHLCKYLQNHPTIEKVSMAHWDSIACIPEFDPVGKDLRAIRSIPNLSSFSLELKLGCRDHDYLTPFHDMINGLTTSIVAHPNLTRLALRCDFDFREDECALLAETLKKSKITHLTLGDPESFDSILHFREGSSLILDALREANRLEELDCHSQTFCMRRDIQEDLVHLYQYISQSTKLFSLVLNASSGKAETFTILRALAQNRSLHRLRVQLDYDQESTHGAFEINEFTSIQDFFRTRFGLDPLEQPSLEDMIIDIAVHNTNLKELSVIIKGFAPWITIHRKLWALLQQPRTSISLQKIQCRNSSDQVYRTVDIHGNDCKTIWKGWAEILRKNAHIQEVDFDTHQHPQEPDQMDFESENDDNWEEAWDEEWYSWKRRLRVSKATEIEIDLHRKEMDCWLLVNKRAGKLRHKYLQDPFALTKREAVELLGAITNSHKDLTWTYEYVRQNPPILFSNSAKLKRTYVGSVSTSNKRYRGNYSFHWLG